MARSRQTRSQGKGTFQLTSVAEKPPIEPTFQGGRYTLVDRTDSWGSVGSMGCILAILLVFDFGWVLFFITALKDEARWVAIFSIFFGAVLLLVTVAFLAVFFRQVQVVRRYEPGELTLSHWPLRLGDDVTVTFQRRLRGNGRVKSSGQLEAKLLCNERVIYHQGTSVRKAYAPVSEIDLGTQSAISGGKEVRGTWQVHIPADSPPSLEAKHNQLRWHVEVWLRQPNAVDDDSVFCLKVLPEVVA